MIQRQARQFGRASVAAAALALAAAGCSSGSASTVTGAAATVLATRTTTVPPASISLQGSTAPSTAASSPVATPTRAVTTTPTTTTTSASAQTKSGCTAVGGGVPAGALHRQTIDVDGDGRSDTLWLKLEAGGGTVQIGITTASGATFTIPFDSASPDRRSVLVARPTPTSPVVVLANDGRSTRLLTVSGCALRTVTDSHGTPYTFDVADLRGGGTGVGCIGPGNRAGLTGLKAISSDGRHYTITRTFVMIDGTVARNGITDTLRATLPHDSAEIDTAETVTCGSSTLVHGGLSIDA